MNLDARTISIFSAITPLYLGFIMLIYLRQRKVYPGFAHWVTANFGLSAGYLLVSLRILIPDFASIVMGNAIVVYSVILIYEGIEEFYGRPSFNRSNYLILLLYLVYQSYFTYIVPQINSRIGVTSFVLFLLIVRSASRLYTGTIPELSRTSQGAGNILMFTGVFPLMHAVVALFLPPQVDLFSNWLNPWISLAFIVSIVAWTFYFFFLNSARLELELERARAELQQIANTDPLTNLSNRRHFNEHAATEFHRAKRYGLSIALLVLDMDDLKTINDRYGHHAGDVALISLSRILRAEVRHFDLAARLGGDEFVLMLLNTNKDEAYSIAERIRKAVEKTPVKLNSDTLTIRFSVGITAVDPKDTDLEATLRRGDRALYRAKRRRNSISVE